MGKLGNGKERLPEGGRRGGFGGGAIRDGAVLARERFLGDGGGAALLGEAGSPNTNLAAHLCFCELGLFLIWVCLI